MRFCVIPRAFTFSEGIFEENETVLVNSRGIGKDTFPELRVNF